jgi:DNA mismatch endonuclease (patch repair protein)
MKNATYLRDGRAPIPKSELISKVMSANKAINTKPEVKLRRALWALGLRGFRSNYKKLPGRPDIAFPKYKVVIFVHGCFWHRCPHCNLLLPKSNRNFWKLKFQKNKERDRKKEAILKQLGWKVLVYWECQVNKKTDKVAKDIFRKIALRAQ